MFQSQTALPSDSALHSNVLKIISYLPVALYAESLRVRSALIRSVATPSSVATSLTGCVRDFGELWETTASDLFEDFGKTKTYHVASLRHGNSFQLANRGLLEVAGLISSHKRHADHAQMLHDGDIRRYTTVHVNFVTPIGLSGISDDTEPPSWLPGVCQAVVVLEMLLEISLGAAMGAFGIWDGSVLMGCMVVNAIVLLFLQRKTSIIFANVSDLKDDKKKTAADGAALDVHVISESWNSCHLDVLAGYSSQLHGLTNLPVWTTSSWTVSVTSRILSVVLLIQAAVLASLVGASGIDAVVPLAWLAVHTLTLIPPAVIHRKYPCAVLAPQPATVHSAGTLHFQSRRSALAFIATLPVSSKVPRWDWLDVFMPNNKRRQEWQEDLETSEFICGREPKPRVISAAARTHLEEAMVAYRNPRLSKYLSAYKQTVRVS